MAQPQQEHARKPQKHGWTQHCAFCANPAASRRPPNLAHKNPKERKPPKKAIVRPLPQDRPVAAAPRPLTAASCGGQAVLKTRKRGVSPGLTRRRRGASEGLEGPQ